MEFFLHKIEATHLSLCHIERSKLTNIDSLSPFLHNLALFILFSPAGKFEIFKDLTIFLELLCASSRVTCFLNAGFKNSVSFCFNVPRRYFLQVSNRDK